MQLYRVIDSGGGGRTGEGRVAKNYVSEWLKVGHRGKEGGIVTGPKCNSQNVM